MAGWFSDDIYLQGGGERMVAGQGGQPHDEGGGQSHGSGDLSFYGHPVEDGGDDPDDKDHRP